jgi:endonuclease-3
MKTPRVTRRIVETLAEQHPNADTELDYSSPFQLLVATVLSAQSSDARVNAVTPSLFARYPDAASLARARPATLETLIVSTGFFRQKTRALLGLSKALVDEHGGEVPADMAALTKLPGVGRKTANVVLGHALGVPGLPVDLHVIRVANRIGLVSSEKPEAIERQLCSALPDRLWTLASDVLILHGRRVCRPSKPHCHECLVRTDCDFAAAADRVPDDPRVRPATRRAPRSRHDGPRVRTSRR